MFVVVNIEHPDEIFQTLEQAYRLVFGWGIVPWEYELGLRSWIFPGLLSVIISISEQLAPGSQAFLPAIGMFMAAASLSIVACAFLWGYRLSGLTGAIIVGTLAAAWGDLVYFAPRTLTEVMAANVFVVGVYLAYVERSRTSRARFVAAGVMFGLAFIFRFHLAPAIALAALWTAVPDWRRRLPWMVLGGLAPVLLSGLVDALTWGLPFQSIWLNFTLNVVDDVSSTFSRQSWTFYASKLAGRWGGAFPILAATALLGVGRMPLLGAIAAAIVLSHTAIAHKEVRFIYPAFPFLIVLCGIGTVRIVDVFRTLPLGPAVRRWQAAPVLCSAAVLFWLFVIASVNVTTDYRLLWLHDAGMIAASDHIAAHGDICGIGVYQIHWTETGGYSHFGHRVPYFDLKDEHDYQAAADGFNVLLFSSLTPPPDNRFAVERCWLETLAPIWLPVGTFGDPAGTGLLRYCVAFRPGPCRAVEAMPPRSNLPRTLREPQAATPAAGYPGTSGGGP